MSASIPVAIEPTEYAVDIRHLSRKFWGKTALDDVSLQIPVGSIFGLVGLNGAGKTTLIRHVIGGFKALHGSVTVLGQDPAVYPERLLKRMGYMTEEDSLPKWMRVGELIDFSAAVYPTWDQRYAAELIDQFDLRRGAKLSSLSKGQRARVGLLVAIAHRPELLVLDEPSSGLDPIARGDILEAVIRTISQDGRTVLFSSHLLDEVDRVCDWISLIHDGQIAETLTMEQMQSRYCEVIGSWVSTDNSMPRMDAAFGWIRKGNEWSGVVPVEAIDSTAVDPRFEVFERRELTLHRWFAARVTSLGTQVADAKSPEEPTHA
jgi:ABC-2 type transport system ATP-binding protein